MITLGTGNSKSTQDWFLQLPPRTADLFSQQHSTNLERLRRSIQWVNYSLGEQILRYQPNAVSASGDRLHLVCQGRVRLLVPNSQKSGQKEITAQLLEPDEGFGEDHRWLEHPFGYRAIASSPTVLIAQISLPELDSLGSGLSSLQAALQEICHDQAQLRQRLIFFRTMSDLRSHPSHSLSQWLPYLELLTLEAGCSLAEATPPLAGRYWLRAGQIALCPTAQGESADLAGGQLSRPPQVGESWGYYSNQEDPAPSKGHAPKPSPKPSPEAIPESQWIAQNELQVYRLPISAWAIAKAFTPEIDQPSPRAASTLGDPLKQSLGPADSASPDPAEAATGTARGGALSLSPPQGAMTGAMTSAWAQSATPEAGEVLFPKPPQRLILDAFRRYPWVEQQSSSDCGAACLSMIARYWGKRFPLNVLRERANVGRAGASLKSLANAAETLGFQARPVRASIGALANLNNPWIAHWEGIHYVVVYKITARQVMIADPAMGRQVISREKFTQNWTGYGLLLDPTDQLKETEIKQASLGRFMRALLPYRGVITQIILVSLLIQCFGLISPLFTQVILDKVVVQKSLSTLNVFALGLLIFGLWGLVMSSVRQYLLSYFSNRLDLTLVSGFMRHVMALPMGFFESRRIGDILTRVQENQKIQQFLIGQVVLAWLNFVTGFVYLGLMLYYNWQLTLLVLLMVPPIVILTLGSTPFLRKVSREIFKEATDQNSALVEMVNGIATVKSTATEQALRWRWEDHMTRQLNARFRGQKLGIGLEGISGVVNSIGSTLLLWYGASLVIQDQLTIGQFVAFNMMIGYVISPVLVLAGLWDELQEVFISVERLNDVFETAPESARGGMIIPPLAGEVEFEDVTFRYNVEEERNTLQNISFRVAAGSTIAIVGRSGSGKSTLVKLLEGLYTPNRGRILIDGHDIAHVEPASLRSQIGVVPQDCFLFSGTILENITLYREDISLEAVVEAAKLAEAHAFIQSFPLGYKTKVGERGATLSGGQRQRIAIARALIGHPRILILDEATSSLDTESERQFQQNLEQITTERTTFIIAHRLSTVRNADRIFVLDRGVIVEQGTHEELVTQGGLYASLAQQQLNL